MPRSCPKLGSRSHWRHSVRNWMLITLASVSMLYLIRVVDCRFKLPDTRVVAVVYEQSNDTFTLETKPIPWWSPIGLSKQVLFRTITPEGTVEGLYPHPAFREREIVAYPDPTLDAYWPGYILSKELPEGMAYSPTKEWQMVQQVRYIEGHWHLIFEDLHLNDTVLSRPIRVTQYTSYHPARSPDEHVYTFHIQAMGGIGARGLGQASKPSVQDRFYNTMEAILRVFR